MSCGPYDLRVSGRGGACRCARQTVNGGRWTVGADDESEPSRARQFSLTSRGGKSWWMRIKRMSAGEIKRCAVMVLVCSMSGG